MPSIDSGVFVKFLESLAAQGFLGNFAKQFDKADFPLRRNGPGGVLQEFLRKLKIDMPIRIANFFHVSTDYLLRQDMQEPDAPQMHDITVLSPRQIEHIQFIVDDLR